MLPFSLQLGEALVRHFSQTLYRCFEEIGSTKAGLYLLGPEAGTFHLVSQFGWPRNFPPPDQLTADDPLVVWASRERRGFVVNQAQPLDELAPFSHGSESLRFLVTPFFDRGEWIGILIQKDRNRGLPYDLDRDEARSQAICQEFVETLRNDRAGRPTVFSPPVTSNLVALAVPVPPSGAMVPSDAPTFFPPAVAPATPTPGAEAQAPQASHRPGLFMPEQRTFFWEAAALLCNLVPLTAVALWMDESQDIRPVLTYSRDPLSPDLKQQVLAHITYHVPSVVESDLSILTKVEFLEREPLVGIFQTYLPVMLMGEEIGRDLMLLFRNEDRPFTEREQNFIQMVGRMVGFHLQEIRLHERYHRAFLSVSHQLLSSMGGGAPRLEDHSLATAKLARDFAVHLELSALDLEAVSIAAILHDVGTFLLDPDLLVKAGPSDEDMGRIRTHPVLASTFLKDFRFPFDIPGIIRHHHERWDGAGYPDGLKGEAIPLGSRIINLIEAFDVMSEGSAFSAPRPPHEILDELRRGSGGQFDPTLVAEFLEFLQTRGVR